MEKKTKRIVIPVRNFKSQFIFEVNVPAEYWPIFSQSLKDIAKLKGQHITFEVREV